MTIYILKRYPTAHKCHGDETIIGYFTSATALRKALRKYKKVFGVYDQSGYGNAVARGAFLSLYRYAELVEVEKVDANEQLADAEEFIDEQ